MNYVEFINCQNNNCKIFKDNIHNNNKLIEIQQKIIKAKSLKTQEKYIKIFNKLKANKEYFVCMINNCRYHLLNDYKENFNLYLSKLKKNKEIPKNIKKSIETCKNLFIKSKLTNNNFKELAINLDNISYFVNYLSLK
jgi:hypothetical protein